jgi:hypothetical protein
VIIASDVGRCGGGHFSMSAKLARGVLRAYIMQKLRTNPTTDTHFL